MFWVNIFSYISAENSIVMKKDLINISLNISNMLPTTLDNKPKLLQTTLKIEPDLISWHFN